MLYEKLKELRAQRGYTQDEVAVKLNVVRQTISKWEKGLSVPDANSLSRLAELYGVSIYDLLDTPQARQPVPPQRERMVQKMQRRKNKKVLPLLFAAVFLCVLAVLVARPSAPEAPVPTEE